MRLNHRLIVALDVTDAGRARTVAEAVQDHVDAVKVNWPLIMAAGLGILRELSETSYILADLKVADIPNTNRLIVEQAVRAGASGIVCHAFPGEDAVKACVDAARSAEVFVLTEMSHPGGKEYTMKHAGDFARLAVRVGATGVIAPATRPERLRALREVVGSRLILSPGVGVQGGKASDAIVAGADAVIVGRAIYEARDPAEAAVAFSAEVALAVAGKSS